MLGLGTRSGELLSDGRGVRLRRQRGSDSLGHGMKAEIALSCAASLAGVWVCSGCAGPSGPSSEIRAVLDRQNQAWNRGDIGQFMEPYWRSADLTFSSGGKTTRGWQATYDRYLERYPERKAMGHLDFTNLEIREMGREAALVLGRWRLEREEPIGGNFTLVMRRVDGHWVIIHDHTSVEAP